MKSTNKIVRKLNRLERGIDTAIQLFLKEQAMDELKKQGQKSVPAKSSKKKKASK